MKGEEVLMKLPLAAYYVEKKDLRIIKMNRVGSRLLKAVGISDASNIKELLDSETSERISKLLLEGGDVYLQGRYFFGGEGYLALHPSGEGAWVILYPSERWDREEEDIIRKIWTAEDSDGVLAGWRRERYLEVLAEISLMLLSSEDLDSEIPKVLEKLRETTSMDRCYLFLNETLPDGTLVATQKYEATGPFAQPQIDNPFLQKYPYKKGFQRWMKILSSGGVIMGDVASFPKSEREILKSQDIISILVVPFFWGEEWKGFIGFDSCRKHVEWLEEEVELLTTAAGIIGSALARGEMEKEIKKINEKLDEKVKRRTAELETLYNFSESMSSTLDIEGVFRNTFETMQNIVGSNFFGALLLASRSKDVYYAHSSDVDEVEAEKVVRNTLREFIRSHAEHLRATEFRFHYLGEKGRSGGEGKLHFLRRAIIPSEGASGLIFISRYGRPFSAREERFFHALATEVERVLQRILAVMKGEESFLASVLRGMSEGVIVLDQEGNIISANPAARKYLPYITLNSGGEKIANIGPYSLNQIISDSRRGMVRTITLTKPRLRHLQITAKEVNILSPAGRGVILTIMDVTRAEEERRLEESELEKFATLGQLSVGIAHEFNNILTSIIGHAEMTLKRVKGEERERLMKIIQEVKQASLLTRQITSIARGEGGKRSEIDLLPLIKEFTKMIKRTLPEKISVSLNYEPGQYTVVAEPLQIQRILINLVSNAKEAMPEGGSLHIELARETLTKPHEGFEVIPPGEYITFEVRDTGEGIKEEDLKRIFDPFFTTRGKEEAKGLGLSIVYNFVKENSGYIDVKSVVGEGTSFKVYLPATRLIERSVDVPLTVKGKGERILVVEDNPTLLEIERDALASAGYEVLTATNGQEALKVLKDLKKKPSVVIADVVMPVMGGETLFKEAKRFYKDLNFVFVSGYGLEEELNSKMKEAVLLQKPFTGTELAEAVRRALDKKK